MTQIIREIEVLYARMNWTPLSPITIIYLWLDFPISCESQVQTMKL